MGNQTFGAGNNVEQHLTADVMDSVKPWLEELLEHYRVLLYSGQLDVIVGNTHERESLLSKKNYPLRFNKFLGAPLTEHMITTFQWSGTKAWTDAEKSK